MITIQMRIALTLAAVLGVAACTTPQPFEPPAAPPPSSDPAAGVETQPGSPPVAIGEPEPLPEPSREPVLSPASQALVEQSRLQVSLKNYAVAAGSIERALRIEPGNPLLWLELAQVRLAEGNYPQAENMARKALSTSVRAPRAQAAAWQLIAESHRRRGNNLEARQAEAKAESLIRR